MPHQHDSFRKRECREGPSHRGGASVRRRVLLALWLFGMVCCVAQGVVRAQALDPSLHVEAERRSEEVRAKVQAERRYATRAMQGRTTRKQENDLPQVSPAELLENARAQHLALTAAASSQAVSQSGSWAPVGPLQVLTANYGLVTGRVTSVAIDTSDTSGNTVYVGTSGGGVWKSTNASGPANSVKFVPLTDTLPVFSANAGGSVIPSLSIGAVTVQPGGTGVVLAGTGDPNDAADSYYGEGLLRSTDNGVTWSLVRSVSNGSFVGEGFAGFAWSTTTPQLVVAAVTSSAEAATVQYSRSPGVRGLYYSYDGGATWTIATLQDGGTVIQSRDSNYNGFRGNAATSVVWNPLRRKFYAAVRLHGYYESSDGVTWTRLANQPGSSLTTTNCPARAGTYGLASCPIFRGALAAQPVSGDLFALTVDSNNLDQGLWQDACSAAGNACASTVVGWSTRLNAAPMEDAGRIDEGDYNLSLAAIPAATALSASDTLLFAGASDLYRCGLSGGCTLRNTTNTTNGCTAPAGVAPAQHAIAWQANLSNSSTPRLFLGNDGGLWRSLDGVRQQAAVCSTDDATHFDNLNGALGSLAQVEGLSSHPTDANVLLAALGANGSAASTSAAQAGNTAAWTQLNSGESGTVAIDQSNGQTWLVQSGEGVSLHACANGSACTAADFAGPATIGRAPVQNDESLVNAPALLDPGLNTNVIAGTCRVFRGPAEGGSSWSSSSAISRFLAGPTSPACNTNDAPIRSLAAGGKVVLTNGSQNSGSSVLYAGLAGVADGGSTYGGHLFVNTSANTATSSTLWTDASSSPVTNDGSGLNAGGFDISSIAVDPSDVTGRTVYATIMGFGYPHVYRSTDAGASWTNISSNLPDAPANGVAVDPNNPLIVYVALDTGVYAATDVTSCVSAATGATGSCWAVLGTALPNAPVLALVATKNVSIPGGTGVLRAGTFGRGIWQLPLLSAGQNLEAVATFSPVSLTFIDQSVGSTSTAQTATLTNSGNTAMQITSVSASAGFAETDTCSNSLLTVGGSCTISVTFSPASVGTTNGSVTVYGNLSGGYASLPLSGTGKGVASLQLAPASLTFASTVLGSTSASQALTLTNSGTAAANLTGPTASADFAVTSTTCGNTLAPGSSCDLSVAFAPTQSALEIGTASIGDGTADYVASLHGTGSGSVAVTVSPGTLDYGALPVNGNTAAKIITVHNSGTATAQLGQPSTTGDFFVVQNDCLSLLAPGDHCDVVVTFGATALGSRTGLFTITDSIGGAHNVNLTGYGQSSDITLTPSSLVFGTTEVGSVSQAQTVTVVNSDRIRQLGVLAAAGDFSFQANTCAGDLQAHSSCSFSVIFTPTSDGPRTGSLTLPDQFGTNIVFLRGNGHGTPSVAVSPAALNFGAIAVNSTSVAQTVMVTNSGTAAMPLQPAVITGEYFIAANRCGATLAAGASCALSVDFTPLAEGTRTGVLTLTDAAGAHSVALNGAGVGQPIVTLSPASLLFAQTAVYGTSAPLTVAVNNGGTASATLGPPSITGEFAILSNTCGSTLAAGAGCSIAVTFSPRTVGARAGVLTLADALANHTASLTGNGTAGALTLTPAATVFPDTSLGSTTAAKTVTVTNTGSGAITLSSITVSGDYAVSGGCAGTTLPAGDTCVMSVTFTPTAAGARSGTLTVASSNQGSTPAVATLTGNGKGAFAIVLTPVAVDFGTQLTATGSAVRNITISNTGNTTGALGSITIAGDFSLKANTCGTSLAAQTGCTVSVVFTPAATGIRGGLLTVVDDAGTQTATLTGTGTAPATDTLSAVSLMFGTQVVNTTSATQTVMLTNSGDTALTLVSATILTGDFTAVSGCGPTLPAHGTCNITLAFTPKSVGALTGTLQITDVQRNQIIPLSGTGLAGPGVSLLPSSLTFARTGVGVVGAGQLLTLSNNGGVPLVISGVTVVGDFGIVSGSGTCTVFATVPVGGSCSLNLAFLPTGAGLRTGNITVTSNAPAQVAQLSGTGVDFLLVTNGDATVTATNGGNAVFPLLLRPLVATSDPVVYTCTGAPANSKCTITSQYGDLSAVQTVSLTILTGTASGKRVSLGWLLLPEFVVLLPLSRRRAWRGLLAAVLTATLLAVSGGCGSGRHSAEAGDGTSSGTGTGGSTLTTPSGTYTITASATAAGVTHTVPLTLIVK